MPRRFAEAVARPPLSGFLNATRSCSLGTRHGVIDSYAGFRHPQRH
jgi:hypothetical protein